MPTLFWQIIAWIIKIHLYISAVARINIIIFVMSIKCFKIGNVFTMHNCWTSYQVHCLILNVDFYAYI